jgi:hypothetical protein
VEEEGDLAGGLLGGEFVVGRCARRFRHGAELGFDFGGDV